MQVSDDSLLLTEEGAGQLAQELQRLRDEHEAKLGACVALRRDGEDVLAHELNEISLLSQRILQLEATLARALVVGVADREADTVGVGSAVTVRWEDGGEDVFTVVGPLEADLRAGRISYESPVGRALLGSKRGGVVNVATPDGAYELEIVAVG